MGASRASEDALMISRRIGEFLGEWAPHTAGRSPHTVRSYADALSAYLEFLESRGVTPARLSREHLGRAWIEDWVSWLKSDRDNSPTTCNVRLAAVRSFLKYLAGRDASLGYLLLEAREVDRQTGEGERVHGMSREAVKALLAAPGDSTPIGRRDTCFLTLAYSTACRLDEVRTLTVGQLRLDAAKPHMTVRGKGGHTRTCYLLPKVVRVLRAYMREALGPDPGPGDLLFPSRTTGGPLSEQAWDKRIKLHAAKARETCPDVPEGAHFHQLRHSKASHWIGDKLNVIEVQHLLGHRQLETTMRYVDTDEEQLADAVGKLEGDGGSEPKKWRNPDGTLREFCNLQRRG